MAGVVNLQPHQPRCHQLGQQFRQGSSLEQAGVSPDRHSPRRPQQPNALGGAEGRVGHKGGTIVLEQLLEGFFNAGHIARRHEGLGQMGAAWGRALGQHR